MEKAIVEGMRVMPGDVLYRIVDPSVVWVEASVYEPDLGVVRVGQRGTMTFEACPGEQFNGRVSYVAPTLDEQTRTAIVRFEIANPGAAQSRDVRVARSDRPVGRGPRRALPTRCSTPAAASSSSCPRATATSSRAK